MQNTIKKIGVAVMTLSMFTLSSCDELKDLLKVDFDLEGEAIYIDVKASEDDPIEAGSGKVLGTETYDRTLEEILEEEGVGEHISKIKEVNLTSITLEIQNAKDDTHSFKNLESISAEIKAAGIATKVVGSVTGIPATADKILVIPVTGGKVDVKSYISTNDFEYAVKGNVKNRIVKDFTIKVTANYSFVFGL